MTDMVNALRARKILGRSEWAPPARYGGEIGWFFQRVDKAASVLISEFRWEDGIHYIHASFARPDRMPSYDDLALLHRAVFGNGYAYQVFAPPDQHVNIHEHALHLWGRADGEPAIPEFARGIGSI